MAAKDAGTAGGPLGPSNSFGLVPALRCCRRLSGVGLGPPRGDPQPAPLTRAGGSNSGFPQAGDPWGFRGAGGGGERGGVCRNERGRSCLLETTSQMIFATLRSGGVKWRFHIQQGKRGWLTWAPGGPAARGGNTPLLLAPESSGAAGSPSPQSLSSCFFPSSPAVCLTTLFCPSAPCSLCHGLLCLSPRPLSFPLSLSDFSRAISSASAQFVRRVPTAMVSRSMYCPPWLSEPGVPSG